MHEMSIAQSLIDIVQEEMHRHGAVRLRRVRLRIGELSAVVPASLAFCFDVIVEGTPMQGAELEMEQVPLEARCRDCQAEFRVEAFVFECPACAGANTEIIAGRDLSIVDMEVE